MRGNRTTGFSTVIEVVRIATAAEWDSAWQGCPYAAYFQSREWANVWAEYSVARERARQLKRKQERRLTLPFVRNLGFTPYPLHVTFSNGTTAILPLSRQRIYRGLTYGFVSSPGSNFGGWLTEGPLAPPHAALLATYLRDRVPNLLWLVNPFDEAAVGAATRPREDHFTQVLDLRVGFEAVLSGYSRGHRSAVTQAIRRGVSVRLAEGEQDWRSFYRVYEASVERWGGRALTDYGWPLLDLLRRRESPQVRLWLAEAAGEVVSGVLCFYTGFLVHFWLGATLAEHFPRRPVNLLYHEAVRDACESGLHWVDLGASSGLDGVVEFKRHFGATELPFPVIRGRRRLGPLTRRPPGVRLLR